MHLPPNRQLKKLSEIFDVRDGTHDSPKFHDNGYPLITSKNLLSNSLDMNNVKFISQEDFDNINLRSKVDIGDLLFAMIGTIGNPVIVNFEPIFAIKNVALFKQNTKEILIEYLRYYLLSNGVINKMINDCQGATQKFVSLGYLRNFFIPFPPLPTQHAIVARLDEASASIQAAKLVIQEQIDALDTLWQSSLSKVFEEGGGEMKTINDISKKIQYGYTGKTIEKGIYRYLRITDIQNNHVNRETVPFVDIDQKEAQKYQLNTGDVIFARTGATVGKSFLIHEARENKIFASYLIRVVPNYDVIRPEFLKYFFQSDLYWAQIFADVVGAAQPNFNGKKLGEVILALPSLNAQQQIVAELDELSQIVNDLKTQYKQQLVEYDALRASILDKAFRGELVK